ncbi:MAG TPA: glucodextranase DOMON-like domain-containing protein [Thermoanaerobaculia bacterium]|nr:glucodextranase DOMON-like domain-containing protein [Thermoanaerobaculia bacterium]
MKKVFLLLLVLLVWAVSALPVSAGKAIFTLGDPRGDDHGDGNLVYPLNDELDPGDLDLISLEAEAEGDGTMFEATFAKPVRVPGRQVIDGLGTSLDTVARFGFYTMNLDIYIDTDRVPGSGAVSTLPGRLATVDPGSAWERAIILTPRPHEARAELKRMMSRAIKDEIRKEDSTLEEDQAAAMREQIPVDVEERIFFPTRVKVRGNRISFFVPGGFLGGPAKDSWSYVVAVSGANVLQSFDINRALGRQTGKEEALMILPISPGKWTDRFGGGRENAEIQPPLVDILVPEGRKQENVLGEFNQRRKETVVLPGVVPAK